MSTENVKAQSNAAIEVNGTGKDSLINKTSEKKGGEKFVGALDGKVRELGLSAEKEANNLSATVDKKVETPTNSFYKKNGDPAASFDSNLGSESALHHGNKGESVYGPLQKSAGDLTGSAQGLSSSLNNSFDKRTADHSNLVIDSPTFKERSTSAKLTVETTLPKSPTNSKPNVQTDILATHGYSGAVPSIPSIPSVSVNAPGATGVSSTHGYSGTVPTIPLNASVVSSTVSAEMQTKTSAAVSVPSLLGKHTTGAIIRRITATFLFKCNAL